MIDYENCQRSFSRSSLKPCVFEKHYVFASPLSQSNCFQLKNFKLIFVQRRNVSSQRSRPSQSIASNFLFPSLLPSNVTLRFGLSNGSGPVAAGKSSAASCHGCDCCVDVLRSCVSFIPLYSTSVTPWVPCPVGLLWANLRVKSLFNISSFLRVSYPDELLDTCRPNKNLKGVW